jgi:uncharacterized protein (TIGR03437 family)
VATGTISATLPGSYLLGIATLDGFGRATFEVPHPPGLFAAILWGLGAGSNTITFSYSGDASYAPAQTNFTQWINKANTVTTAVVAGSSQPIRLSATVAINEPSAGTFAFSIPGNTAGSGLSGTVQFFNGTSLLGTATLAPSGLFTATAAILAGPTPADLIAVYSGDGDFNGSSSAIAVQTGTGAVTFTVTSSANPTSFAEPVALQIAVAPAASTGPVPTGTVTASILGLFALGSVMLDAGGRGSITVPQTSTSPVVSWGLAAGTDSITLRYSGDSLYAGAQTIFSQTVAPAATNTTATLASSTSITATVSLSEPSAATAGFALPGSSAGNSSPGGGVQFWSGGTVVGGAQLSPSGAFQSVATLQSVLPLPSGLVAVYSGDGNYLGSTSSPASGTPPTLAAVTIGVSSSVNPSTFAQPVTFAVSVAPAVRGNMVPTGTVQASVLGVYAIGAATLDANGNALFTVPQSPSPSAALPWGFATGSNAITVTYSGDSNFGQSRTSFNQLVNRADSATSALPAPVPIGASLFTIFATVSVKEFSVSQTGFGIPAAGNVSTSPTGSVYFYNGPTLLGSVPLTPAALFQSTAVFQTPTAPASLRAVYYGDNNYNASSSSTNTQGSAPFNISMVSSTSPTVYGARFTISALVVPTSPAGPTPTGTMSFFDGTQNLGWIATLDSAGRGSLQIPSPLAVALACVQTCPSAAGAMVLGAGSHAITARYSGDANYAAATSPVVTQEIIKAPSTTSLAQSGGGLLPAATLHLAASVADTQPPSGGPYHFMAMNASGLGEGDPTGAITFLGGSTPIGTAMLTPSPALSVTSTASLDTTNGSTSFSAVYSGDNNFQPSAFPSQSKTATTLAVNGGPNPSLPGQSVTLTATISPNAVNLPPTGTVNFLDGATFLGLGQVVAGVATLTTTFAAPGPHSLTVNYSGDANYLPSSAPWYQAVIPAVTPAVMKLTVNNGNPAVFGEQDVFFAFPSSGGAVETVPPFGTVYFYDGAVVIGAGGLSLGSAYTIVSLPVGPHQISAAWAGDGAGWPPGRSAVLAFTVNRASTSTSLTPTGSGFAATVSVVKPGAGTPTGTVQFIDTVNQAVLATAPLAAGSAAVDLHNVYDPVEAVYSGDSNFVPSTSAPTTVFVIANPAGSAASTLAPEEIATIYGPDLATSTAIGVPPLSTSLAGVSVTVTDSAGTSRLALLYYVSPGQINFVVPAGTGPGAATVFASSGRIAITVANVAPNLYPVAQIVRVHPDGTQTVENDSAAPIVFGSDSLYLVLYGSGIRNRSSLAQVTCAIGKTNLAVTYAGAQAQFPGLDQVVVPLSAGFEGLGIVPVMVTADGQASNSFSLTFQ